MVVVVVKWKQRIKHGEEGIRGGGGMAKRVVAVSTREDPEWS